jgi:hypothetical protein
MTLASYSDLQPIFTQGSLDTNFYVIKTGTVDVVKDGVRIRSIAMLDYFGERSILSNELRSASIVAKGPVTCWILSKESFIKVVSQRVIHYLASRIAARRACNAKPTSPSPHSWPRRLRDCEPGGSPQQATSVRSEVSASMEGRHSRPLRQRQAGEASA